MTRSRMSAKNAGTNFETAIAHYFATYVDDRIERRRLSGANDRGDLSGLRVFTERVIIECKEYGGVVKIGTWLGEADKERRNDDAECGIVIAKRKGTTDPGDQTVIMTVRDLIFLLTGKRPAERDAA